MGAKGKKHWWEEGGLGVGLDECAAHNWSEHFWAVILLLRLAILLVGSLVVSSSDFVNHCGYFTAVISTVNFLRTVLVTISVTWKFDRLPKNRIDLPLVSPLDIITTYFDNLRS